jgi:hypothetical protein
MAATYRRMPNMAEVPPAAWDLAYLIDAAGGLDNAARLVGTTPDALTGWLTGQPTALLALATRRLAAALPGRLGWSFTTEPYTLRAVA